MRRRRWTVGAGLVVVALAAGCAPGADDASPAPSATAAPTTTAVAAADTVPSGLVALVADERFGNRTLIVIDPATGRRTWSRPMPDFGNDFSGMDPTEPMTAADRAKKWFTPRWSWGKHLSQDWSLATDVDGDDVRVHAWRGGRWERHASWTIPDLPEDWMVVSYFDHGSGRLVANAFNLDDDAERWHSVDPRNPADTLRAAPAPLDRPERVTKATTAAGVAVEWVTSPDGRFAGGGIGAGRGSERPYECGVRAGAPTVWCFADFADQRPAHGALVAVTVDPATNAATLRTVVRDVPAGGLIGAFAAPGGGTALLWTGNGWLTAPADGSAPPSPAFTEVEGVTPTTHLFPLTWI